MTQTSTTQLEGNTKPEGFELFEVLFFVFWYEIRFPSFQHASPEAPFALRITCCLHGRRPAAGRHRARPAAATREAQATSVVVVPIVRVALHGQPHICQC